MGPAAATARRRCPRCTWPLAVRTSVDGEVDVCPRCRGTFFDAGECAAVLGPHADSTSWETSGFARGGAPGRLACPDAHGPLRRWRIDVGYRTSVEVDVCAVCRGLWLDAGEAQGLRRAMDPAGAGVRAAGRPGRVTERPLRFRRERTIEDGPPPGEARSGAGWYVFQLVTGMPLEVWNPVRTRPVACLVLIAACALVFVVEMALAPAALGEFLRAFGAVPADLLRGEHLHAVVSHIFLHAGLVHAAGNLWFLWMFGDNVEDRLGRARFAALFLGTGLAGLAAHVAIHSTSNVPVVGASGAIAGLMGAYGVLFPSVKLYTVFLFVRWTIPVWLFVAFWAAMNVLGALAGGGNVAWVGHLGGLAAGAGWALTAGRRFRVGAESDAATA